MNLGEIITRLEDVYGNTLTSSDAYYTRVVNDAYVKLCGIADWWWLEAESDLTLNAVVRNYTITATSGANTATFSTALPGAYGPRSWIKSDCGIIYRVATVLSSTSVQLESNWQSTTTTAESITIWGDSAQMNTNFEYPLSVSAYDDQNLKPLRQVSLASLEAFGANTSEYATEIPDRFAVYMDKSKLSTEAKTQLLRYFPPAKLRTAGYTRLLIRYRLAPPLLTSTLEIPYLPLKYHSILVDMAKLELFKNEGEDPDRINLFELEVQKGIQMLIRNNSQKGKIERRFHRRGIRDAGTNIPVTFINTAGNEW